MGRGRVQNLNQSTPDAPDGNQDREGIGGGCRLACGCWPVLPRPAEAALSREEYPPALPQLVAIDDCAMSARHVVKDAALDKRVHNVVRLAGTLDRDMPYDAIFYPRFLK